MKEITRELIKEYKLKKLGFDFMGYNIPRNTDLSFHHTIISHKLCKELGLGEGYWKWNGSILVQDTSHDYLHIIENIDEDMFYAITSELIDQINKGYLDKENLVRIQQILKSFEREHCADRNKKGKLLIKQQFTRRCKF